MMMKNWCKMTRYCIECGGKLVYYANLSNPKAPNNCRILTYACPKCTKNFDKPTLISIKATEEKNPIRAVQIEMRRSRK